MSTSKSSNKVRGQQGQNQLEFAAVFAVLVLFVLVPLIDLVAIPIRMAFAISAVKESVHNLALSAKFSQAQATLANGSLLQARINTVTGVSLLTSNLAIVATNSGGSSPPYSSPGGVPQNWLPDGKDGPYRYNLLLACDMDISPLFLVASGMGADIPGLTQPFRAHISESYAWGNRSKDPATQQFFLNE